MTLFNLLVSFQQQRDQASQREIIMNIATLAYK